jgi:hypothetical protein
MADNVFNLATKAVALTSYLPGASFELNDDSPSDEAYETEADEYTLVIHDELDATHIVGDVDELEEYANMLRERVRELRKHSNEVKRANARIKARNSDIRE